MHPASDDPGTRTALAALQVGALRWLGGGAIAVVLGVLLGAATVSMAGEEGRRVPGAGLVVLALVLGGLAAVVVGGGALLRTSRWRRALAGTTWRPGRLYVAGPAVLAFEPDGGDEAVQLRLLSTAIWRTRAVQALDGAAVLAAPVGSGQWVFTAEGAGTLYGARAVTRGR
ncbi:hypothetical protein E9549_01880 [Blastococcus sp. MG754426]|uniref:hypothetical protein n=1 Tax=unclassified Blastococcus TaxID=2619396 RepID=UPI001EF0985A|nr:MULTISPECIES: hypothetical protein [unclassified Blastococcus]MCF6506164.1 hypothetical protein [Blastococcus sp. MG754426]MCF6510458.1 hypothetical protein [Blastococcus sp. MG754427]MCF6735589.1 hypothetical protein [Blastococcus sp. KM273129]